VLTQERQAIGPHRAEPFIDQIEGHGLPKLDLEVFVKPGLGHAEDQENAGNDGEKAEIPEEQA
jgi:hypothetical protein